MKQKTGLWIDHKKAVIVKITGELEEIKTIVSEVEKHIRFSGGAQKNMEEDQQDRKFTGHLNKYYDNVISYIKDAEAVLIMGPGEAKVELIRRLETAKKLRRIIGLESADKLTIPQITAKVREQFCGRAAKKVRSGESNT